MLLLNSHCTCGRLTGLIQYITFACVSAGTLTAVRVGQEPFQTADACTSAARQSLRTWQGHQEVGSQTFAILQGSSPSFLLAWPSALILDFHIAWGNHSQYRCLPSSSQLEWDSQSQQFNSPPLPEIALHCTLPCTEGIRARPAFGIIWKLDLKHAEGNSFIHLAVVQAESWGRNHVQPKCTAHWRRREEYFYTNLHLQLNKRSVAWFHNKQWWRL